jgi:hypothetical protein
MVSARTAVEDHDHRARADLTGKEPNPIDRDEHF